MRAFGNCAIKTVAIGVIHATLANNDVRCLLLLLRFCCFILLFVVDSTERC